MEEPRCNPPGTQEDGRGKKVAGKQTRHIVVVHPAPQAADAIRWLHGGASCSMKPIGARAHTHMHPQKAKTQRCVRPFSSGQRTQTAHTTATRLSETVAVGNVSCLVDQQWAAGHPVGTSGLPMEQWDCLRPAAAAVCWPCPGEWGMGDAQGAVQVPRRHPTLSPLSIPPSPIPQYSPIAMASVHAISVQVSLL